MLMSTSPVGLLFQSPFLSNTPTTRTVYTLSLHDALPICWMRRSGLICLARSSRTGLDMSHILFMVEILLLTLTKCDRSEERFSRNAKTDLVCRLLLEKKKVKVDEELGLP